VKSRISRLSHELFTERSFSCLFKRFPFWRSRLERSAGPVFLPQIDSVSDLFSASHFCFALVFVSRSIFLEDDKKFDEKLEQKEEKKLKNSPV
jgi:hypothetical protein